jgi:hypothetical protein
MDENSSVADQTDPDDFESPLDEELEAIGKRLQIGIIEADEPIEFRANHRNKVVVFFVIATELLNDYTEQLLVQELIPDEYHHREDVEEQAIAHQLKQKEITEILVNYQLINSELHAKIRRTREIRNELVHEPKERHHITNIDKISKQIETVLELIDELQGQVN